MNRVVKLGLAGSLVLAILAVPALSLGPETAGAQACVPSAGSLLDPYPGTTAAASSFESGTVDGFGVSTSGTGTVSVSAAQSHSGNCAAVLHTTATAGSLAKMTADLAPGATDVYADGWFNIAGEGKAGNNVPYFRFFAGRVRVMDVFRQNITHELVLRTSTPAGFTYTTLRQEVPTDSWHRLVCTWSPTVPRRTSKSGGTGAPSTWARSVFRPRRVDTVQLGSEHDQQMADIYVDDVIINSGTGRRGRFPVRSRRRRGDPSKPLNDFRGDGQPAVLAVGGRASRGGPAGRRPVRT